MTSFNIYKDVIFPTLITSPPSTPDDVTIQVEEAVVECANASEDYDYIYSELESSYGLIWGVQTFFIPLICALGTVGNLSSAAVFLVGSLKSRSCIMYLATKCVSDTLFLMALFIVWLDHVQVYWFHRQGICQMVIFITYVCGFLSVWLVVLVTVENYIQVCHPNAMRTLCTPGKARATLLVLSIVSVFCYNFPLWTTNSRTLVSKRQCLPIPEFSLFNEGLTYFDTIVTLVLPSLVIFLSMTAISSTLIAAYWRSRRDRSLGGQRRLKHFCLSPYGRLTVMLTAVSATFTILHTPSHVIRLRLLVGMLLGYRPTLSALLLQRLFEVFYYINFALNSVTYLLFGKSFRGIYRRMYFRRCCGEEAGSEHGASESSQNVCEATPDEESRRSKQSKEGKGESEDMAGETIEMKLTEDTYYLFESNHKHVI